MPLPSTRLTDAILLGAIVVVVTIVYAHYALRVATFQDDESLYIQQARLLTEHFPSVLFQSAIFQRGLQRLDQLLLAIPFLFVRGPYAFEIDRVIQCLLFTSAAIPAFLLARGAGLGRLSSQLVAVLAVVVPWAVVSASFLTESAAYPTYAWSLYAVWAAITRPSLPREALAVLAIVLAAFSRTAMLALAPILPLAVLWQEAGWELSGTGLAGRARSLPSRLWRRHPLVSAVTAAVVSVYLAARLGPLSSIFGTLTGKYGIPHVGAVSPMLEHYEYYLSRTATGTGLIALAIGLPWLLHTLARPRDGARHALAVVCLLGVLCMLLSTLTAGPDERYVVYAAVPVALMFVAGLKSRPGLGVLGGAVIVDLLIESATWPPLANLYDYFTYPAAIFYQRVLLGHASVVKLPAVHLSPERLVQAAVLAVALAWILAGRSARVARPAAAALGAGVLALCSTQTLYALEKYVTGAGAGVDAAQRSWVDSHVPDGASVSMVPVSLGLSGDFAPIWATAVMWNASVVSTAAFQATAPGAPELGRTPLPMDSQVYYFSLDDSSGALSVREYKTNRPVSLRYVLVPHVTMITVGFDAERSQTDPSLLVDLERLRAPARLEWMLNGTSDEGFMTPGAPAEAVVYSSALSRGRDCAGFVLNAPAGMTGAWPFVVQSGRRVLLRSVLTAARPAVVSVPLLVRRRGAWPISRLTIRVHGSAPYLGGTTVSARVNDFAAQPCRRHA